MPPRALKRSLIMQWLVLCAALFVLGSSSQAAHRPIDYSKVTKADVVIVRKLLVRYLVVADDPCLTIQYLKPGGRGELLREKAICALGGAKFDRDFALVDFRTVEFFEDRLVVEVEFIPSRRGRKAIRWCTIDLKPDLIGDLKCMR